MHNCHNILTVSILQKGYLVKTTVQISCAVMAQLICTFVLHMQRQVFLMMQLKLYSTNTKNVEIVVF